MMIPVIGLNVLVRRCIVRVNRVSLTMEYVITVNGCRERQLSVHHDVKETLGIIPFVDACELRLKTEEIFMHLRTRNTITEL